MWQSRLEIKDYSVAYFDRFAAFEVPYRWTSIKGGTHMRFVDSLDIHASMKRIWAPPLMEVQRFKHNKAIEICNRITFDFYMGLPHINLMQNKYSEYVLMHEWGIVHYRLIW